MYHLAVLLLKDGFRTKHSAYITSIRAYILIIR